MRESQLSSHIYTATIFYEFIVFYRQLAFLLLDFFQNLPKQVQLDLDLCFPLLEASMAPDNAYSKFSLD